MTATPDAPQDPPRAKRKQYNVRLPEDLIADIDARRARKDLSRDKWTENALRFALQQHPDGRPAVGPNR